MNSRACLSNDGYLENRHITYSYERLYAPRRGAGGEGL